MGNTTCKNPDNCKAKTPGRHCHSCVMKGRHADPVYRKKLSEKLKVSNGTPEFRARMSRIMKKQMADPDYRMAHHLGNTQRWNKPGYRQKFRLARRKKFAPWCPESYLDEYFFLARKLKSTELAKQMVLEMTSKPKITTPCFQATPNQDRRAA